MKHIDSIKASVFKINTSSGTGSGFAIDAHTIMTNYHVVAGSHQVGIENFESKKYVAKVILVNPDKDMAFLRVEDDLGLKDMIQIDEAVIFEAKQKVVALGYPFGMGFTVTEGIISNSEQNIGGRTLIQTDAAINPGNSGGPLVNEAGQLLGINSSKFNGDADNVGFAISLAEVLEEIQRVTARKSDTFAVVCSSCDECIEDETEFCPSCGGKINKVIFQEKKLDILSEFVESAIEAGGVNPVIARAGHEWWEYHQGSSEIRIFVFNNDYLYATSPLVKLPKKDIEPLYEYIFSQDISPFKFGVSENYIYLSYRFAISDLYVSDSVKEECKTHLTNLALKSDELDDMLIEKYACEKTSFSGENLKK